MSRRRILIGFVEVETDQQRVFRHAATGMSVDEILAEGPRGIPKPYHDEGNTPEGRLRYWCVADGEQIDQGDDFRMKPIYRTSRVPADAECEDCGIRLRELQEMLT